MSKSRKSRSGCEICFELGGVSRNCCNHCYCDYCYGCNGKCPNCKAVTQAIDEFHPNAFQIVAPNEREECRLCLEQGRRRPCCGEYYCDICYHKMQHCKSCGKEIVQTSDNSMFASTQGSCMSYIIPILMVISVLIILCITMSNEVMMPVTLFDYRCTGLYQTCDQPVCVTFDGNLIDGPQNVMNWKYCDLDSNMKLQAAACIYDKEMYAHTNTKHGFDICRDLYVNGAVVFEDDFENWINESTVTSSVMQTAKWLKGRNARSITGCGYVSGSKSLVLSGDDFRDIYTTFIDIQFGGKLEFMLKVQAPSGDETSATCKPAYQSTMIVAYSVDQGDSWSSLKQFEAILSRSLSFISYSIDLPESAWSNQTQFKFYMLNFENRRDHVAFDNVKVISFFKPGWNDRKPYKDQVLKGQADFQQMSCCQDTERCETRLTQLQRDSCNPPLFEFLRGVELYIFLAGIVSLFRLVYWIGKTWVETGKSPLAQFCQDLKRNKVSDEDMLENKLNGSSGTSLDVSNDGKEADDDAGYLPSDAFRKEFKVCVSYTWRKRFAYFTILPLLIVFVCKVGLMHESVLVHEYRMFGVYPSKFGLTAVIVLFIGVLNDMASIFEICKDVVCILDRWVPKVVVDARSEVRTLFVGSTQIKLQDVREMKPFDKKFLNGFASSLIFCSFPWCTTLLLLKESYGTFELMRVLTALIGGFCIIRSLFGPDLLIKFYFFVKWFFTDDIQTKNQVGLALTDYRVKLVIVNLSPVAILIAVIVAGIFEPAYVEITLGLSVMTSLIYSYLLGFSASLPIRPWFILASLGHDESHNRKKADVAIRSNEENDLDIGGGVWVWVTRRAKFPCLHRGSYCTDMHTQEVSFFVNVENRLEFLEMLTKGNSGIKGYNPGTAL